LLSHAAWRSSGGIFGRIAQLVEQLTLNQRVKGSSPFAPTNKHKYISNLFDVAPDAATALFECPHHVRKRAVLASHLVRWVFHATAAVC
jgi:hypothetical protein